MITEEEAARVAARLKDALGSAADVMGVREVTAPAQESRHARPWLVPLTAAACVVAVALASVFVAHRFSPAAAPAAGPPEFYAVLDVSGRLEIRRTSGGQITAVTPPIPLSASSFSRVSATADDRTFFVMAGKSVPRGPAFCQSSRFYRLTVTAKGRISGFGPVGAWVPGGPRAISASPDGSRVAYGTSDAPHCGVDWGAIHVMDVMSGAVRSWHNTVHDRAWTQSVPGPLSWRPDGRTLVVGYTILPSDCPTVLALDTSSAGGSLQAHSHVLYSQRCTVAMANVISGPAGTLTAIGYRSVAPNTYEQLILGGSPLFSVQLAMVFPPEFGQLSADASGRYLIVYGGALGLRWLSHGELIPLAAPRGIIAAAW